MLRSNPMIASLSSLHNRRKTLPFDEQSTALTVLDGLLNQTRGRMFIVVLVVAIPLLLVPQLFSRSGMGLGVFFDAGLWRPLLLAPIMTGYALFMGSRLQRLRGGVIDGARTQADLSTEISRRTRSERSRLL